MSLFSRLFQAPVNYVEHKVDEVREEVRAELAEGLASLSIYLLWGTLLLLATVFLSIALSIGIAIWSGMYYLGFLAMGVIYATLSFIIWRLSKNEVYMGKLRYRFQHILSKNEHPASENEVETEIVRDGEFQP